jgi:hypothetical protein
MTFQTKKQVMEIQRSDRAAIVNVKTEVPVHARDMCVGEIHAIQTCDRVEDSRMGMSR